MQEKDLCFFAAGLHVDRTTMQENFFLKKAMQQVRPKHGWWPVKRPPTSMMPVRFF